MREPEIVLPGASAISPNAERAVADQYPTLVAVGEATPRAGILVEPIQLPGPSHRVIHRSSVCRRLAIVGDIAVSAYPQEAQLRRKGLLSLSRLRTDQDNSGAPYGVELSLFRVTEFELSHYPNFDHDSGGRTRFCGVRQSEFNKNER